jgi:hypothetical protein
MRAVHVAVLIDDGKRDPSSARVREPLSGLDALLPRIPGLLGRGVERRRRDGAGNR